MVHNHLNRTVILKLHSLLFVLLLFFFILMQVLKEMVLIKNQVIFMNHFSVMFILMLFVNPLLLVFIIKAVAVLMLINFLGLFKLSKIFMMHFYLMCLQVRLVYYDLLEHFQCLEVCLQHQVVEI